MSDRDYELLAHNVDNVAATIREFAAQIISGDFGTAADGMPYGDPTVDDGSIYEYPLEVVAEIGREYAVVICTGGPHVEVVADGDRPARLVGYWGGSTVSRGGDAFDTFLDYFIDRD